MKYTFEILALCAFMITAGCASNLHRINANYGKDVARMIREQTLYPQRAAHPPTLAPPLADGQRMENVLKEHRKSVPSGGSQSASSGQFSPGNTP